MTDPNTIKPDPDASPAPMEDDDIYEDAGDLEFYDPASQSNNLYLLRIGKAVWDAWSKLDDEAEIAIGTLRQWYEKTPAGEMRPRMKMLLNSDIAQHQLVPKEYNLNITDSVLNTYVFSEEDLPGYKAKPDTGGMGLPRSFLKPKPEKVEKTPYDRKNRYQPYYRKAIPKKTKIFGKIAVDLSCAPIVGEEREHLLALQTQEAAGNNKVQILEGRMGQALHVGTKGAVSWENKFIKSGLPKPTKAKVVELKAARIPENELLDQLFRCFSEFQYWSLRALRQRLQQPEAYLRQTLEKIALLNKSGRFANLWSVKPENVRHSQGAAEVAPDSAGDDMEEDDDIKMEDVLP